ncbi:MAG: MFS transporter [Promethearchaeota archaeon]
MQVLKEKNGKVKVRSQIESEYNGIYYSNIWKLYLFHFFMGCHLISGVLLPFFLGWGKLTFVEVMILQGYFTIMIFVFEIPCGAISDYLSRKLSLIFSGIVLAIAALLYGSIPDIIVFFLAETFFALGVALNSGTDQAFLHDTLKKIGREEELSKFLARTGSFTLLGILISAPIGSLLTLFVPLNYIFTLMFFPFIAASIIALTLKEPNHDLERESKEKYLSIIKSGFKELKKNKILRILAIELTIVDALAFLIIWTYQLYLEELNVPLIFFGLVASAMTLTQIILTNLVPKLEDRFKNKRLFLILYTLIPGLAYILLAFILFIPISITLVLIVVGFGISRQIIFFNGINKQIETENRATVLSTINMISGFTKAIIFPLIGIIVMYNLKISFIILGITIILFALLSQVKNEYL